LRLCNVGRADRGHALATPSMIAAVHAPRIKLDRDIDVDAGFRLVVQSCIMQIQGNEHGISRGDNPEMVHQMRVGIRRLRSALRLFSGCVAMPASLRDELNWLANELGPARDAEILCDVTLPTLVAVSGTQEKLDLLQHALRGAVVARRQRAATVVDSVRYSRLMLGLGAWLEGSRWRTPLDESARRGLAKPLRKQVPALLSRLHKNLLKAGKGLANATPDERHRARIAAKRLRYAAEFFESLLPRARIARYIERLAALQDLLGRLNDAAVGDGLLREAEQSDPALVHDASLARRCLLAAAQRDVDGLRAVWRRFKSTSGP